MFGPEIESTSIQLNHLHLRRPARLVRLLPDVSIVVDGQLRGRRRRPRDLAPLALPRVFFLFFDLAAGLLFLLREAVSNERVWTGVWKTCASRLRFSVELAELLDAEIVGVAIFERWRSWRARDDEQELQRVCDLSATSLAKEVSG